MSALESSWSASPGATRPELLGGGAPLATGTQQGPCAYGGTHQQQTPLGDPGSDEWPHQAGTSLVASHPEVLWEVTRGDSWWLAPGEGTGCE